MALWAALIDDGFSIQADTIKDAVDGLHSFVKELEERGLHLELKTNSVGGSTMKQIDVVLVGADKLSQQLDAVEELVHKLRRALADLDGDRMHLEMRLNPIQEKDAVVMNNALVTATATDA